MDAILRLDEQNLQCCGDPFKVGDTVTWQGCHTGKRDAQTDTYIGFTENHHVMNEDYIIRDKITHIYADVEYGLYRSSIYQLYCCLKDEGKLYNLHSRINT